MVGLNGLFCVVFFFHLVIKLLSVKRKGRIINKYIRYIKIYTFVRVFFLILVQIPVFFWVFFKNIILAINI